jgi:AraC-like DNA-binding protein
VSELVDDPALGLHCAEEASTGAFGVIEKLLENSATLGEGMSRVARHFALLVSSAALQIECRGPHVHLLCHARDMVPVAEDLLVASLVLRVKHYLGEAIRPLYVRVTCSRPRDTSEYERIINSSIYFSGTQTELVFDRETFDLEIPGANPVLAEALEGMIARRAAPWTRPTRVEPPTAGYTFLLEVDLALGLCLENGGTQLHDLAAVMGTSPRSLQRHLRAAGSCFHHLVSEQRARFLAQHSGQLSKAGAARRLGYADRRSLRRAEAGWPRPSAVSALGDCSDAGRVV